jgi:hypothetical protein
MLKGRLPCKLFILNIGHWIALKKVSPLAEWPAVFEPSASGSLRYSAYSLLADSRLSAQLWIYAICCYMQYIYVLHVRINF